MNKNKLINLQCFKDEALSMFFELSNNKLLVVLSGEIDQTGRKLRCVESKNPSWYREIFQNYTNGKKGKFIRRVVRRYKVLQYLVNLSNGCKYKNTQSYNILIDLILDRLINGYYIEEDCFNVQPQITKHELIEIDYERI